jgi:molybdenum cofactor synthesis domain-containing protein
MKLVRDNVKPINRTETINLEQVAGRILATDIIAEFNVPPFERASMDGYAVKAENTFGASKVTPIKLRLMGVQHTGEKFLGEIGNGECLEIATGSPMPNGANAVIMVEYTISKGNNISVWQSVKPSENVASIGEDIKTGDHVIKKGAFLTPGRIGAIAALGFSNIEVYAKPRVAIYSSGPEIVPQNQPLEPGQIYDVNSFTLTSVIQSNGCIPTKRGIMKDTIESIEASIKDAVNFDMGVFSGGSSVGSKDLFGEIIKDLGHVYFHGVKVKPGKPTLFALVDRIPIFGMPGYPTSCLSNSYVFLTPAIRQLARLPPKKLNQIVVSMGHSLKTKSDREQFITVRLDDCKAYRVFKKSGDITSMTNADGYIVLPIRKNLVKEGEKITVTLLE